MKQLALRFFQAPARLLPLSFCLGLLSCSALLDTDVGEGIGQSCADNDDCQAGKCDQGICTAECAVDADCPAPTKCKASKCQYGLKVRALYQGVVAEGEGWTLTHHEALDEVMKNNEFSYIDFAYKENMLKADLVTEQIDKFVQEEGAQVIIGTSNAQMAAIKPKVEQYPDVKFLAAAGFTNNDTNLGSFMAYIEHAFYIAGKVAAQKAKNRLGFVAAYITPQVVRRINAFTLGARSVNPSLVVEVRWLGWWSDYRAVASEDWGEAPNTEKLFLEELHAERLAESGCEIIAHATANGRAVRRIDVMHERSGGTAKVFSVGNDNQNAWKTLADEPSQRQPIESCLGAVYYNWVPVYSKMFDEIHRNVWKPANVFENISASQESVVSFAANPQAGLDDSAVRGLIAEIDGIQGLEPIYQGPYEITGQRDADKDGNYDGSQELAAGESPSAEEINAMCWFVKGVVERTDPNDPQSADRDAMVPDGKNLDKLAAYVLHPPGTPADAEKGKGNNCLENQ